MATPVKIMPPIDITYAKLTSSNVAETEYGDYAAGTTYALGDLQGAFDFIDPGAV